MRVRVEAGRERKEGCGEESGERKGGGRGNKRKQVRGNLIGERERE